ncbi:MAG: hypothetical protein AABX37_04350 [Nanoarchaeota archaeon]
MDSLDSAFAKGPEELRVELNGRPVSLQNLSTMTAKDLDGAHIYVQGVQSTISMMPFCDSRLQPFFSESPAVGSRLIGGLDIEDTRSAGEVPAREFVAEVYKELRPNYLLE